MRSLSSTIVALAVSGVCCAQLTQQQELTANQQVALKRVVSYLDQVTLHARYAFDCSLVRVTAHPTPKVELLDGCVYLDPFISGKETGPLVRCVGGVNGTAWYVDVVKYTHKGARRRSYYDGKWTAFINPSEAKDRVTVIERYFDPGIGVAPWRMFSADSGSILRDLRAAQKLGKLTMESRTPTNASDAGVCRVDQGDHSPRPPTDPDVRDYRIRLLESRARSRTTSRMNHVSRRQRIPLQELRPPPPGLACLVRPPAQPLAPDLQHRVSENS
jgi:hypothetical protein